MVLFTLRTTLTLFIMTLTTTCKNTLIKTWLLLLWPPPGALYPRNHLVPFTLTAIWSLYPNNHLVPSTLATTWFLLPWQPPDPIYPSNHLVPFALTTSTSLLPWQPCVSKQLELWCFQQLLYIGIYHDMHVVWKELLCQEHLLPFKTKLQMSSDFTKSYFTTMVKIFWDFQTYPGDFTMEYLSHQTGIYYWVPVMPKGTLLWSDCDTQKDYTMECLSYQKWPNVWVLFKFQNCFTIWCS